MTGYLVVLCIVWGIFWLLAMAHQFVPAMLVMFPAMALTLGTPIMWLIEASGAYS